QGFEDLSLSFYVLIFRDVAVFQMDLQLQQLLLKWSIIGPLFFRNFSNGVEDELDPIYRQCQQAEDHWILCRRATFELEADVHKIVRRPGSGVLEIQAVRK